MTTIETPPGAIVCLNGDATDPRTPGQNIVAHVCNDLGGWGRGFVLAVSRRWPEPERAYREWHRGRTGFGLGEIQLVRVAPSIQVANMIGQHGFKTASSGPPVRYDAIRSCLARLAKVAAGQSASVHMPRIGCGLAGGRWDRVEPLIEDTLLTAGVPVYVYDYG